MLHDDDDDDDADADADADDEDEDEDDEDDEPYSYLVGAHLVCHVAGGVQGHRKVGRHGVERAIAMGFRNMLFCSEGFSPDPPRTWDPIRAPYYSRKTHSHFQESP